MVHWFVHSFIPQYLFQALLEKYSLSIHFRNKIVFLLPAEHFPVVSPSLDSIFKSRDITLPTKVRLVKAVVFPVVMYGCENWTVKKLSAEELMLLNCGVGEDS